MFPTEDVNPELNADLPYTLDRSEGVTVMHVKEGPYKGEEVVVAHMCYSLEWCIPSPPPVHTFEEAPIIKERPSSDE